MTDPPSRLPAEIMAAPEPVPSELTARLAAYLGELLAAVVTEFESEHDETRARLLVDALERCGDDIRLARAAAAITLPDPTEDYELLGSLWPRLAWLHVVASESDGDDRVLVAALHRYLDLSLGELTVVERVDLAERALRVARELAVVERSAGLPPLADSLALLAEEISHTAVDDDDRSRRTDDLVVERLRVLGDLVILDRATWLPELAEANSRFADRFLTRYPDAALCCSATVVELSSEIQHDHVDARGTELSQALGEHIRRLAEAARPDEARARIRDLAEHVARLPLAVNRLRDVEAIVSRLAAALHGCGLDTEAITVSSLLLSRVESLVPAEPTEPELKWLADAHMNHLRLRYRCEGAAAARSAGEDYVAVWARARDLWPRRRGRAVAEARAIVSRELARLGDTDGAADFAVTSARELFALLGQEDRGLKFYTEALTLQANRELAAGRTEAAVDTAETLVARCRELVDFAGPQYRGRVDLGLEVLAKARLAAETAAGIPDPDATA